MLHIEKHYMILFLGSNGVLGCEIYLLFIIILFIYKSCDWIHFFHGKIIKIVLNNGIQIYIFSNQFIFLRGKKNVCVRYWKKIKLKF